MQEHPASSSVFSRGRRASDYLVRTAILLLLISAKTFFEVSTNSLVTHGVSAVILLLSQRPSSRTDPAKSFYCKDDKRRALPPPKPRCVFPRSTQPPILLWRSLWRSQLDGKRCFLEVGRRQRASAFALSMSFCGSRVFSFEPFGRHCCVFSQRSSLG